MSKKTWKIGEYAKGGIIIATTKGDKVKLECRDYFTKELVFWAIEDNLSGAYEVLTEWTSVYYADKVLDWIKSHSKLTYAKLAWEV